MSPPQTDRERLSHRLYAAMVLPLKENLERLRGMRDQDGAPLRVVTLPMPPSPKCRPLCRRG